MNFRFPQTSKELSTILRPKERYQITLLTLTWPHILTTLVSAFYLQNHPPTTLSLKPTQHLYCFADISLLWIFSTQQSWNFITDENFISTFCVSVFESIEEGHKSKFAQFNLELHSSHPLLTNAFLLYPVPYFLHVPAKEIVSNQWQKSNIVLHLGFINALHGKLKLDAYTCYKAMQHILHSHQWIESGGLARSWPNTATVSYVYYMPWIPIAANEWKTRV